MSEKKGPSWRVPDRDVLVQKHTRAPSSVPDFITEEGTGRVEGDELKRIRAKRPTSKRLEKLEERHDKLDEKHTKLVEVVTDVRVLVGAMSGKMDAVLSLVPVATEQKGETERAKIGSRTKIVVAVIGVIGAAIGALKLLAGCL